jgi:putative transposase
MVKQCQALDVHRSALYYQAAPESTTNLQIMRTIDKIHLKRSFLGVIRITDELEDYGYFVNHKRVYRLMQLMGIMAIYPKPKLSQVNPEHKIYPYLLRNLTINRPNQVWATDITYIPMAKGFIYLVVIMDWYSRKILSYRLSNSMDASFCVDALEEAIYHFGCPEIFNSDQGSQFTSVNFTQVLKDHHIQISMDGKGAWRDNVFVERLWRSVKYEEVYLNCYQSMGEAKRGIGNWIKYYNNTRKHQTLGTTPALMYTENNLKKAA